LSRCLKAIPSQEENKSRFLVGSYTSKQAFLHSIDYDVDKNELNIKEVVDFEKAEKNEMIFNEVIGIYSPVHLEDIVGLNNNNGMSFFVQVFNQTDRKYQLKMLKNIDGGEGEIIYNDIKASHSNHIFEYIFTKLCKLLASSISILTINLTIFIISSILSPKKQ